MRRNATPGEIVMWRVLRDRRFDHLKFRRQHPFKEFILDFCCPALNLRGEGYQGSPDLFPATRLKQKRTGVYVFSPDHVVMSFNVNGEDRTVVAPVHHTLLEVLREELGLTGTKHGCELGECGTCTVLVDGTPVLSCLVLAIDASGHAIETVEGLQSANELHPLQAAFADLNAAQCGYCTPGILMAAKALIAHNPDPSTGEVNEALAGNLCRCTGYHKIIQAVQMAAATMRGDDATPQRDVLYGSEIPETKA